MKESLAHLPAEITKFHQQITEGNLIPAVETAWSKIAYVQTEDKPSGVVHKPSR